MKIWRRAALALVLVSAALLHGLTGGHASAADARFSLTSSPLPINLNTTPGHSVTSTVRVQNSGAQVEHVKVEILKFKAAGSDGRPILSKPGPADEFINWISFSPAELTAQPGEWNDVKITANPPLGAGLGYYFAIVFVNADSPSPSSTAPGNVLNGGVATMVLLNVKVPGEKIEMNVASFTATKKLYEFLPATFNVAVANTGNIHGILSGSIFITKHGKKIATLDANPGGGNILPGSTRVFSASWSDGFPVFKDKLQNGQVVANKQGQNVQQLSWDTSKLSHFRFGHYTARFVGSYDNGSQDVPLGASLSFWVIPWKLIAILLVVLGLVLFGLLSGLRSTFGRKKK